MSKCEWRWIVLVKNILRFHIFSKKKKKSYWSYERFPFELPGRRHLRIRYSRRNLSRARRIASNWNPFPILIEYSDLVLRCVFSLFPLSRAARARLGAGTGWGDKISQRQFDIGLWIAPSTHRRTCIRKRARIATYVRPHKGTGIVTHAIQNHK